MGEYSGDRTLSEPICYCSVFRWFTELAATTRTHTHGCACGACNRTDDGMNKLIEQSR